MEEFLVYNYNWPDAAEVDQGSAVMQDGRCVEAAVWLVPAESKEEAQELFINAEDEGELLYYTLDEPPSDAIVVPYRGD